MRWVRTSFWIGALLAPAGCDYATVEFVADCSTDSPRDQEILVRNLGTDVAVVRVGWDWTCDGREHETAEVPPGAWWSDRFPSTTLDVTIWRRSDGLVLYASDLWWGDFEDGDGTVEIAVAP